MPRVEAVMESALYVSDLGRAVAFYRDVVGLRLMQEFEGQKGAAFAVGSTVLLLFRSEATLQDKVLPPHGGHCTGHIAFRVAPEDLPAWRQHLVARGVKIEKEHRFGSNPPAIYFRDPDNNLLELAVPSIWPWPQVR